MRGAGFIIFCFQIEDPRGQGTDLFVPSPVEPPRADPYSPLSPRMSPKSRTRLFSISSKLRFRPKLGALSLGLLRTPHLGVCRCLTPNPSPSPDSLGVPSPLEWPPPRPPNYPLAINDTFISPGMVAASPRKQPPLPCS